MIKSYSYVKKLVKSSNFDLLPNLLPPPPYGVKRGGQKISKFQMHHRTKCDISLESWYSEVSENILLYNMFGNYPPPLWAGKGGAIFFKISNAS